MYRFILALVVCLSGTLLAQQPTFRDRVVAANDDVTIYVNGDGPIWRMDMALRQTDLVVRGTIMNPRGHFTEDGQSISTTYEITNPKILFSTKTAATQGAGTIAPPIAVVIPGGTAEVNGHRANIIRNDVPIVPTGTEVVALLSEDGDHYVVAGSFAIFGIRNETVYPLANRDGEHRRFSGFTFDQFLSDILARRTSLY